MCHRGGGQAAEAPGPAQAGVREDAAEAGGHREALCRARRSDLRPGLPQPCSCRHLHQPSARHCGRPLSAGTVQVRIIKHVWWFILLDAEWTGRYIKRISFNHKISLFYVCLFLLCSDLKVKVADKTLSAHKFVLAARSDVWSLANMASTSELDLSGEDSQRNFSSLLKSGLDHTDNNPDITHSYFSGSTCSWVNRWRLNVYFRGDHRDCQSPLYESFEWVSPPGPSFSFKLFCNVRIHVIVGKSLLIIYLIITHFFFVIILFQTLLSEAKSVETIDYFGTVSSCDDGFPDCKPEVAMAMLRWAYTDELELSEDDAFLIDLMKLANRFQLQLLRERSAQII